MLGNYESIRNRIHTKPPPIANSIPTKDFSSVWMDPGELNLLLKYLKRDVTNYLEWGSGGSTEHFPRYVSGRYVSIEHDAAWCNKLKSRVSKKVELRCISVPRGTLGWGISSPFDEGTYPVFKEYVDEIATVSRKTKYWDFVLIDGRCRVDAAIKALSFIRDSSVVALHDSGRMYNVTHKKDYRELQNYYDVVEEFLPRTGLSILKRKDIFARLEGHPELAQKIIDRKYNL